MSRLYSKSRDKRQHNHSSESDSEEPTTLSGTAPGRALFDTPPPDSQAPVLERSQRARKASARKLESLQSQATAVKASRSRPTTTSKSSTQPPARGRNARIIRSPDPTNDEHDKHNDNQSGQTRNIRPPQAAPDPRPALSGTQVATVGTPDDSSVKFLSKENVLFCLEQRVGHKVTHLSARELEDLANSMSKTEAASMEAAKWNSPAIVQSAAPLDVGGGYYRNRFGDDVPTKSAPQPPIASSNPSNPSNPSSAESHQRATSPLNPGRQPLQHTALDEDEADDEDSGAESLAVSKRPGPRKHPPAHQNNPPPAPTNTSQAAAGRASTSITGPQPANPHANPTRQGPPSFHSLGTTESEHSDSGREAAGQPSTSTPRPAAVPGLPTRPTHRQWPTRRSPTPPDPARLGKPMPGNARLPARSPSPPRATPTGLTSQSRPTGHGDQSLESSCPPQVAQLLSQDDLKAIFRWALDVADQRLRQPPSVTNTRVEDTSTSRSPRQRDSPAAHQVASTSVGPGPSSRGRKRPRSPDEDSTHEDTEPQYSSKDIPRKNKKSRKKPGLGDYPEHLQQLAKPAIPDMMALAISEEGSYGTVDQYCDWAERSVYRAWKRELPMVVYASPPRGFLKILGRRGGSYCGKMKLGVRVVIVPGYGFNKQARTPLEVDGNRLLCKKLGPTKFYLRDVDKELDPYEHPAISEAIAASFFADNKDVGVRFPHKFNPMPLPAVALVLTLMQFCIGEWESGYHEDLELDAEEQQHVYDAHLAGLTKYAKKAGVRLARFQEHWFKYGMESVPKPAKPHDSHCQPILQDNHIRPDTPPPGGDDNSQPFSRSKGKGRAVE